MGRVNGSWQGTSGPGLRSILTNAGRETRAAKPRSQLGFRYLRAEGSEFPGVAEKACHAGFRAASIRSCTLPRVESSLASAHAMTIYNISPHKAIGFSLTASRLGRPMRPGGHTFMPQASMLIKLGRPFISMMSRNYLCYDNPPSRVEISLLA
jgi:hypothetical protein